MKNDARTEHYQLVLFKTLANINRLRIVKLLLETDKPMSVCIMADKLNLNQGNLSNHLIKMRQNGILQVSQDGMNMYYGVKDPAVSKLLSAASL